MRGWASIVSVGFDDFCRFCAVRRSGRPRRQTSRPPDTSVSGVSHGPAPHRAMQFAVPAISVSGPLSLRPPAEPWYHRRTVVSPPNRGVSAEPWRHRRTVVSPPNRGVSAEPWRHRRTVVSPPDRGVPAGPWRHRPGRRFPRHVYPRHPSILFLTAPVNISAPYSIALWLKHMSWWCSPGAASDPRPGNAVLQCGSFWM